MIQCQEKQYQPYFFHISHFYRQIKEHYQSITHRSKSQYTKDLKIDHVLNITSFKEPYMDQCLHKNLENDPKQSC